MPDPQIGRIPAKRSSSACLPEDLQARRRTQATVPTHEPDWQRAPIRDPGDGSRQGGSHQDNPLESERTRGATEEVVRAAGVQKPDTLWSALRQFLNGSGDRLWVVDQRVLFDGDWERLFEELRSSDASLLPTTVRSYAEDPEWKWWASLKEGNEPVPPEVGVAPLLPLIRIDRLAAEKVLEGLDAGWSGHPEALVPTLINRAGLRIEDLGGGGSFTPAGRADRWYDNRTRHWRGPVQHVPGKLHFPTTLARRPFAAARLA